MTMTERRYRMVPYMPFSWESQRDQYPAEHEPGFRYTEEFVDAADPEHEYPIGCLLLYAEDRTLVGILNRFGKGVPGWEEPGAITLNVDHERRRQGIATRLLVEIERRFGPIDWDAQHVTPEGRALAESFRKD